MATEESTGTAVQIGYSNGVSGLAATDVQGAIDEVATGAAAGFGSEYQQVEDTTFRSTTGVAFFGVHTLTTPVVPVGAYRIEWLYIWSHDANGNDFNARVQVDNLTELYAQTDGGGGAFDAHQQEPKDAAGAGDGGTNQRHVTTGWADVVLTAGVHTIDIDISTSVAGVLSSVHRSAIAIYRVA